MNPLAVSILVFSCAFGGVLIGMKLRSILPPHHLNEESKKTVDIGIGLIATIAALVLGLVTASSTSSFNALDSEVKQTAANILSLDRRLAQYGPETREIRLKLKQAVSQRLERIWPQQASQLPQLALSKSLMQNEEQLIEQIRQLSPKNVDQHWAQSQALDLGENLLTNRWVVMSDLGYSIPLPYLTVLIFWLFVIFISFGLFAPRNTTVIIVLLVCTLSISAVFFLILEMNTPFKGMIKVSPEPLHYAYTHLGE